MNSDAGQAKTTPAYGFLFDGEEKAICADTLADILSSRPDLSSSRLIEVWCLASANVAWLPEYGPWQDINDDK